MNDLIAVLPRVFPVLNGGLLVSLIWMTIRARLANRKLTIDEYAGLRREFIDEMGALRGQVSGLRDDNDELRVEVRNLRRENGALRDEVKSLNDIITGMSRQTAAAHRSAQRVITEILPHSPEVDRAMKALGNIEGDKGGATA